MTQSVLDSVLTWTRWRPSDGGSSSMRPGRPPSAPHPSPLPARRTPPRPLASHHCRRLSGFPQLCNPAHSPLTEWEFGEWQILPICLVPEFHIANGESLEGQNLAKLFTSVRSSSKNLELHQNWNTSLRFQNTPERDLSDSCAHTEQAFQICQLFLKRLNRSALLPPKQLSTQIFIYLWKTMEKCKN